MVDVEDAAAVKEVPPSMENRAAGMADDDLVHALAEAAYFTGTRATTGRSARSVSSTRRSFVLLT